MTDASPPDLLPAGTDAAETSSAPASALPPEELERLTDDIVAALKTVYDPEIPVNIYELGLIYDVTIKAPGDVHVLMTLTAPACPVAETLPPEVEEVIRNVPGVSSAKVEVVWELAWDMSRMSDEAKLELGLARGRKQHDKRHAIAARDADREATRAMSRDQSGKNVYD